MENKKHYCPPIRIDKATPTLNSSLSDSSHSNPHYVYVVVNGDTIDNVYTRKRDAHQRQCELLKSQMSTEESIDRATESRCKVLKFQISHNKKTDRTHAAEKSAESVPLKDNNLTERRPQK